MIKHKLFFALALCMNHFAGAQIIITIAGDHGAGYNGDGGPAISAEIKNPHDVAVDAAGNIYIADDGNQVIRKISPSGIISTFAGTSVVGYSGDGGPATSAKLNAPWGVAVDTAGNVYIAEFGNNVIRKVNKAGIISTVAGNNTLGYSGDGGLATSAELARPADLVVDDAGNMFIADYYNHAVRKVNTAGIISTYAGMGTNGYTGNGGQATSAKLGFPNGVDLDTAGNLFIAENYNQVIRKVNTAGIISTVAGNNQSGYGGDGGPATSALLYDPTGVVVDPAGNLFISEQGNRVRMVNTSGIINTYAGNGIQGYMGDGGPATLAEFSQPANIALDASGNIFIADNYNHVIREIGKCIPLIPSICMVEVDSTSTNNIIYWDKSLYVADTFYVYRDTSNNNYAPIGKVPYSALSMFVDTVRSLYAANGDPNVTSWRYKISYNDTCGGGSTMSGMSPWHQSIYQYNIGSLFIWNHYQIEGQPTPVPGLSNYVLKRDNLGGTNNWVNAATASASSTNINDPQYSTYQANADWKVETLWNTSCTPTMRYANGTQGTVVKSRSNIKNNKQNGINSLSGNAQLKIYPNPADDAITISIGKNCSSCQVEIINLLGEEVRTIPVVEFKSTISITEMQSGVYFIKVVGNNKVLGIQKLIVQH